MKTEFRAHEGLTGSGVVCSLTYDNYRVVFDFGAPFKPDLQIYDGFVLRRHHNALLDALRLKETPLLNGVYPKDALKLYDGSIYHNLESYEESELKTCVIISHLHLDHMSNIQYLHKEIPVYMHENGKALLNVLEDIGEGTPHEKVIGVQYEEPFMHGPFKITPYFNDHPCFGSTSYYIECPDIKVLYTGDIRFHGLSRERAFKEIEKLGKKHIDLLVFDGQTYSIEKFNYDFSDIETLSKPSKEILKGMFLEQKIYDDVKERLHLNKRMGLFNLYHRDMQLIQALDTVGRTVVYEVETAYVIGKLLNKRVHFYQSDYKMDPKILDCVKAHNTELTFNDLNANPEQYLVQVSYKNIMNLFSLEGKEGYYFHLFGDPFGKTNRACQILQSLLKMNEIEYVGYSSVYSFNHAFPNQLSWMIETLDPMNLVCVHANNPEQVNPRGYHRVLPKQNEAYVIEQGVLILKD